MQRDVALEKASLMAQRIEELEFENRSVKAAYARKTSGLSARPQDADVADFDIIRSLLISTHEL